MTDQAHKLQVKIGDAEFSGEGAEAAVQQQYKAFLDALQTLHAAPKMKDPEKNKADSGPGVAEKELMERVYVDDPRSGVSLKVLPQTQNALADTLLLLLYGYQKLRGETSVTAIQLGRSAKQSGKTVERIDREFDSAGYEGLYTKAGQRAGSRYGLKNPGITKAKGLLEAILG